MLSWRIKNKEGRYLHFTQDDACTIIKTRLAVHAHIFKGTRDLVDGICMGIKLSIGEDCEPEQIIHVQQPKNDTHNRSDSKGGENSKWVDDIYAGN